MNQVRYMTHHGAIGILNNSCGCQDIYFGSYWIEGCPMKACYVTDTYQRGLAWKLDTDTDSEVLAEKTQWREYWESFADALQADELVC